MSFCLFPVERFMSATSSSLPKYAAGTQPFTVFIEGNIGSGKTTFLNYLQQFQDKTLFIAEPVEKWRNLNGVNLLEKVYSEPERWAMPFQHYVTLTMLESHTKLTNKPIKVMERSLFSAKNCFVENMYRNKVLDDGMYSVLQEWYKFIEQTIHIQADLIVYLRTSPEVAYERMRRRGRSEESCVPLKYLQELHELHENWLRRGSVGNNVKVLEINGDLDLENINDEFKRSENSIINASLNHPQPQAVLVSPSKRQCFSN